MVSQKRENFFCHAKSVNGGHRDVAYDEVGILREVRQRSRRIRERVDLMSHAPQRNRQDTQSSRIVVN